MKKIILLSTVFFCCLQLSNGQTGELDPSFGTNGLVHQGTSLYTKIAIDNSGRIITAGHTWNGSNFEPVLARYNTNGKPDSTFGDDGIQVVSLQVISIAVQNDGKIVAIDTADIVRYNADGSPDNTFSGDGIQTAGFTIAFLAIQSDGKIVVVGSEIGSFAFARFNTDGTPDQSFSDDGKQVASFTGSISLVAIRGDGRIVVAGVLVLDGQAGAPKSNAPPFPVDPLVPLMATYNPDGNLPAGSGWVSFDITYPTSMAIGINGNIVIAGGSVYQNALHVSLLSIGSTDLLVPTNLPFASYSMAIQRDGKIILGGPVLARFNTDFSLDNTFSGDGIQAPEGDINAVAISNNKLYAVGSGKYPGTSGVIARYLLNDGSPAAPAISLVTPAVNATYLSRADIQITAAGYDPDGTISKVEFYKDSTLLYTAIDTPYTFKWQHVPIGNYTLTAKAIDNDGLITTSAPVQISVVPNKAPTVNITNPANNQTFLKGPAIHLEAAANDPDGRIIKVEFYNGTTLLATERKLPYTYDWTKVLVGNYTITAKAYDNRGAVTISAAINISVVLNQPPSVSVITPANGDSFTAPATINLEATAQDADGRITKVEFYNGSTLLTTERMVPYTYEWQNVPAGTYNITAVATDNWGAKTTSAPIEVTVTSPAPMARSLPSVVNSKIGSVISLKLAPNPANNILNIYTTGLQKDKRTTISVISSSGVTMKTMQKTSTIQSIQLNVASLVSGVYTIKLMSVDNVLYKKFVKL